MIAAWARRRRVVVETVGDVLDGAGAAGRDHRDVHRVGDGTGDLEVVARRRAVAVDAVDDDLACAEILAAPHPVERVESGRQARAVDEDLVAARDPGAYADVLDLRAEHDALPAERLGALADDVGVAHGHRVDADLLGPGLQHLEHVVDRPDAAADGERDEDVVGDAPDRLEVDLALLGARLDVVEDDLVDLVVVELLREILGRGDVDVVLELLGLRDASVDDVEAGDEALRQHQQDPSHAANRSQQREPDASALLGVELRGDDVVPSGDRAELVRVLGAARARRRGRPGPRSTSSRSSSGPGRGGRR